MSKSESLTRELEIIREFFDNQFNPGNTWDNWIMEIFDDYVIASFGADYFQVPYSTVGEEIVFSSRSEWVEVERDWIAKNNYLKAVSKTDTELRVANYMVLFGGKDLVGETFTSKTDFESRYTKTGTLYVDWEHGYDWENGAPGRDDILGVVDWKTAKVDDRGLWVERALDRQNEYMVYLEELIESGVIGSSSEATSKAEIHAGTITKWPLKRDALTVTPMEPRMLSENTLQAVKALVGRMPSLKALIPETGATGGDEAREKQEPVVQKQIKNKGDEIMDEKEKEQIKEQAKAELLAEQEAKAASELVLQESVKAAVDVAMEEISKTLPPVNEGGYLEGVAPGVVHRSDLGDVPEAAFCRHVRTGDLGALAAFAGPEAVMKASNATDMNITTAGDGGNAVPTGHYQGIIAKLDEAGLDKKLGLREIPGKGTSVDVPYDNEDDGEFIETAESGTLDQDAPALGKHTMTLVAYTKQVNLTWQLLEDEDSKLMVFLEDFIGRGIAKTKNSLLLTEAANGTQFDEFASATAIVFGEPENIVGYDGLDPYLDESGSVAWVMKSSTHWHIKSIVGNARQYPTPYQMASDGNSILGYPVHYSAKAGARTAALKPVYFGNWNFMGVRNGNSFGFLRDPYSSASKGWVNLFYYFRTDYKVLQTEAIGYGQMATA